LSSSGIERIEEAIGHRDVKLARRLPAWHDETLRLLSHAATDLDPFHAG
jgi:hypothetical protein